MLSLNSEEVGAEQDGDAGCGISGSVTFYPDTISLFDVDLLQVLVGLVLSGLMWIINKGVNHLLLFIPDVVQDVFDLHDVTETK